MLLTEMVVPKIVSVMIVQIKCGLSGPEASRMKPQTLKIPTTLTLQETCAGEDFKGFFLSVVQYTAGLFAAISMIIYTTMGAKCISKIIGSGRRMIMMMQPSKVLTCVTLVTCFAGHADASRV